MNFYLILGGGQNFERRNVERKIFRNFKIANMKITKIELFESFIFEFIFLIFKKIFEYSKYLIILKIVKYWFSK